MTDPNRITAPFERPETPVERLGSLWARVTEHLSRSRNEFEIRLMRRIDRLEKLIMANDRDLLATIAAGLAALGPELDRILAENSALKAENAQLKGEAAADEAGDVAAAQPAKDALDALIAKLAPVAPAEPTPIEDVPGEVDAAPEPAPVEGDQPA